MRAKIYTSPLGTKHARAYLTTESPASHYGVPALRLEGTACINTPDLGPADVLGSGVAAAALVHACAIGRLPEGMGGTIHQMDAATREAARKFCGQWPEGPQVPSEQEETMATVTDERTATIARIADAAAESCPEIVACREVLGQDGTWYSPFGLPWGFRSAGQTRTVGYCYRRRDGVRFGTRAQTPEELAARWAHHQAGRRAEFVEALQGMDDEQLDRQAAYWIK